MKLIDLTHTYTDKMPVYPGDPPASLKQVASIEKDTYTDHQINSYMHVGTHLDAPSHIIAGGKSIDQLDLKYFFGKGILIDARGKKEIDESLVEGIEIPKYAIVFIYTGFSEKYRTKSYYENFPIMTKGFAQQMVDHHVKIVGMDILGPDTDTTWPAHNILLGKEILIIENLTNLGKLLGEKDFEVIALPAKYQAEAAPVRVIAKIEN